MTFTTFSTEPNERTFYLGTYPAVSFYKCFFPDTANVLKEKTFSFVHLDVDIYSSTQACLDFFYSRMEKGGIILSHDYAQAAGVKKAFQEFFHDKPESIIELAESQC
ncbi:MAG: TylF/MycF/NovP-related O-methyltransferase, partial [Nanoarchaeota archaeon]|nr:TylF/MycF/NovP-related O-methyltransferase [Nanoarchaeota archaeon]